MAKNICKRKKQTRNKETYKETLKKTEDKIKNEKSFFKPFIISDDEMDRFEKKIKKNKK